MQIAKNKTKDKTKKKNVDNTIYSLPSVFSNVHCYGVYVLFQDECYLTEITALNDKNMPL